MMKRSICIVIITTILLSCFGIYSYAGNDKVFFETTLTAPVYDSFLDGSIDSDLDRSMLAVSLLIDILSVNADIANEYVTGLGDGYLAVVDEKTSTPFYNIVLRNSTGSLLINYIPVLDIASYLVFDQWIPSSAMKKSLEDSSDRVWELDYDASSWALEFVIDAMKSLA